MSVNWERILIGVIAALGLGTNGVQWNWRSDLDTRLASMPVCDCTEYTDQLAESYHTLLEKCTDMCSHCWEPGGRDAGTSTGPRRQFASCRDADGYCPRQRDPVRDHGGNGLVSVH